MKEENEICSEELYQPYNIDSRSSQVLWSKYITSEEIKKNSTLMETE